MPILYRPARAEDLQRAGELVAASINELCERHGFAPMAAVRPPTFARFSLEDDADGLWVAEDAGEIVGFAFSWACGDLWFLAQLFVSPDRQGCGIGPALLERTLAHAQSSKARTKALITFAFNTVSQGLYMRRGCSRAAPSTISKSRARPSRAACMASDCAACRSRARRLIFALSRRSMSRRWAYHARNITAS